MPPLYTELSLSAQTAYAELLDRTRSYELTRSVAGLAGSFQRLTRGANRYWYFAWRDPGTSTPRLLYVGPDTAPVRATVERLQAAPAPPALAPPARAAIVHGCAPMAARHFRILRRLADYGLFRVGGVLVGTHAFVALGNMLGLRWEQGAATLDIDVAHAGRNLSVALPANMPVDVHGALDSLELGLLPIGELDGRVGAQYRSPLAADLRVDFLTPMTRSGRAERNAALNVALEPLKFMEFSLEAPEQAVAFASSGAVLVNVPAPARFAVHKLIVYGERPARERTKARKDLYQAAAVTQSLADGGRAEEVAEAWQDALRRGAGWRRRAQAGLGALIREYPEIDRSGIWSTH